MGVIIESIKTQVVKSHLEKVRSYRLEVTTFFEDANFETILKSYNGIGPDRFPWVVRTFISVACSIFAPCALPHDFDYSLLIRHYLKGILTLEETHAGFERSNERFYRNMLKIIDINYSPANPISWVKRINAWLFYRAVCRYGWRGIVQGIKDGEVC